MKPTNLNFTSGVLLTSVPDGKGTSGFTSNTLLRMIQYCYQFNIKSHILIYTQVQSLPCLQNAIQLQGPYRFIMNLYGIPHVSEAPHRSS